MSRLVFTSGGFFISDSLASQYIIPYTGVLMVKY
jgi:hypothetical protein